jgi:hypothetical protein
MNELVNEKMRACVHIPPGFLDINYASKITCFS